MTYVNLQEPKQRRLSLVILQLVQILASDWSVDIGVFANVAEACFGYLHAKKEKLHFFHIRPISCTATIITIIDIISIYYNTSNNIQDGTVDHGSDTR